jgi:hypothetical protein
VEQARAWTNHNNDFVSLFYDGHNCFTTLLAGDREDDFFIKKRRHLLTYLSQFCGIPTVFFMQLWALSHPTFFDRVYGMLAKVGSGGYLDFSADIIP